MKLAKQNVGPLLRERTEVPNAIYKMTFGEANFSFIIISSRTKGNKILVATLRANLFVKSKDSCR